MKFVSIVGARPQFVKVWPIASCMARQVDAGAGVEHLIVHTGQHYSRAMSAAFFEDLGIPEPDVNLGVGSGSHGAQTGRMLIDIERVLVKAEPDVVLLYGDTNSTLAGALAASKLGVRMAHIEAGLRSRDRRMPEEVNRIVADHAADLLLAPTATAVTNLEAEGLGSRTVLTGDVMYDAWVESEPLRRARREPVLQRYGLTSGRFALATVHRAMNVDARLSLIVDGLNRVAASGLPVLLPVHPRTAKALALGQVRPLHPRVLVVEPVGYLEMGALLEAAHLVLTDSGGVQKEAFFAGCPTVTLRAETEWIETIECGANVLAGDDPERIAGAVQAWERTSPSRARLASRASECYGGGQAAARILSAVTQFLTGAPAREAERLVVPISR